MAKRFSGSMIAVVTPLKGGKVDLAALKKLMEWQLAEGTEGLVPCGTTGESATLTHAEKAEVIRAAVEVAKGRVPVLAGAGSNSTAEAIEQVKQARELGADGALVVTPYYNKPTQEGLLQHYRAIYEASGGFPVVAYNVPSRTSVDLLPETVARLVKARHIAGVKDATANMDRQIQHLERCGLDGADWLSGDDFTVLPFMACGGHGVISVVANCAPRAMADLVAAARAGKTAEARASQVRLAGLNRAMFVESSPGPVKVALHLMGRIAPEIRLPLAWPGEGTVAKVREALAAFGIKA